MKIVLDTNIYSYYAEGDAGTVDFLAMNAEEIFLPAVVIGELFYGFSKGSRFSYNDRKLKEFIEKLDVQIIPVDSDVARKYGLIYLYLQGKGTPIPINDVWIAASCMNMGGTLVTKDRHFETVEQIEKIFI